MMKIILFQKQLVSKILTINVEHCFMIESEVNENVIDILKNNEQIKLLEENFEMRLTNIEKKVCFFILNYLKMKRKHLLIIVIKISAF